MKVQGTKLKDARVLFFGAGSSAVGVAHMIAALLMKEAGLSKEEAYKHIWVMDSKGIITKKRGDKLPAHKESVARDDDTPPIKDLREAIAYVKPHALIGLSGYGHAWDQGAIEEMCKHCERPLIFPLSNPTDKSEVTAEDAIKWTKGKCIFASGSPFKDVEYEGRKIQIGQANNVFIFPGTGFGSVMTKAKMVKNEMFLAAARALADYVSPEQLKAGRIYPTIDELRPVSAAVATGVAEEALQLGVAQIARPNEPLKDYIKSRMWDPSKRMHADSST
jgi:malic enzyme